MKYIVEESLSDFKAWSGGKDTLEVLINKDDCESVEELIEEMYCGEELPSDTNINDFLWFERDCIAEHLGYRDWDAYEEGWSESDLEDAEDWFSELDFDGLEKLTGKRRDDYSDEDGYQDFVDACEEWWNAHEDKEKVELYESNCE